MATIEELSAALVKADAAGNVEDAQVFADAIRQLKQQTTPKAVTSAPAPEPAWYDKPLFGQKWLGAPKELVTGSRAVLEGAVALPGLPYDIVAGTANLAGANLPSTSQGINNLLNMAGVPQAPETMTTAAIRGGAGALTGAGAANMLASGAMRLGATQLPAPALALSATAPGARLTMPQFLAQTFAEQPITQGIAGATAGASSELARQRGAGTGGQMAAGLAGGVAPIGAAKVLTSIGGFLGSEIGKLGRSIYSGTEAGRRELTDRVTNELYLRTFGGATPNQLLEQGVTPENIARMEQAARFAQAGETGQTIAVLQQDPVLANFVAQRLRDEEVVRNTADVALEQRQQLAGPLAGAREFVEATGARELAQRQASLQSAEQAAEGFARQNVADQNFPPQDLEQIGRQTRGAATSVEARARAITRNAYDEVDALGADLAPIPAGSVRTAAENIIGDAGFAAKDVPELANALAAIRGRTQRGGFMNLQRTEGEPTMTWPELTSVLRAVNADMRSVAQNPELRPKLRNLRELKRSVQGLINSAPEEVIPQELKTAFADADALFRQEYVRRFRSGNQQRNMLLNRNGAPVIADEDIIKTFFKPGGATPARRFLDMLGDNPVAIESMEAGIRERYRQEVIRNGAVDPAAHARFMDKYRAPLGIYEDAGADLSAIRAQGEAARVAEETGAGLRGAVDTARRNVSDFESQLRSEVRSISDLQATLNAAPDNAIAANTMDDVTRAVQDVEKFLSDESQFDELLSYGRSVPNAMEREIKPESAKVPLTIIEEILYNNTNKLLTKNLRGPLAAKIGKELLDSPTLRAALEKAALAASKRKFRVPVSKQISASAALKGATINALTPNPNNNRFGSKSLLTPKEAARMAEEAAGNTNQLGAP